MRAAISLLVLLLWVCGAQARISQSDAHGETQSTGAATAVAEVCTQLDVSAELKELRDMVVELSVTLRYTQDEVKVLDAEHVAVKERLVASETKVGALEREVDNLKKENDVQEAELTEVKTRLAASEAEVVNLRKETAAQSADLKTRLAATEANVDSLETDSAEHEQELAILKTRLAAAETDLENLSREIKAAPKVAFSAGLTDSGYIEAGNTNLNLVFSKVFTNVGEAYSNTTGFFTAPIRGVYYFRFTVVDNLYSRKMYIKMHMNGQQLMLLVESDTDGEATYLSSGLTLQLEEGDLVNLVVPAGYRLCDDHNNHSTFSGFLLFPL